ncbi:hypothetical protein CR513_53286, partial [Mucuna pruriens]
MYFAFFLFVLTHLRIVVDGALNHKGSEVGVIFEGFDGVMMEQSLYFEFRVSNNQVEYKTLLIGMKLAKELGAQVNGDYQAKDPQLIKYWNKAQSQVASFERFTLFHNERADLLSKLASTRKSRLNWPIIQEMLTGQPSRKQKFVTHPVPPHGWTQS